MFEYYVMSQTHNVMCIRNDLTAALNTLDYYEEAYSHTNFYITEKGKPYQIILIRIT